MHDTIFNHTAVLLEIINIFGNEIGCVLRVLDKD
jgi:hypothetical protein